MYSTSDFTHKFFQDSSKAWKSNKTRYGQAMYTYKKNAFEKDPDEPPAPKPSRRNEKECLKRQQIDEYAPPRVRRSPRIRLLQKEIH